MDGQLCVKGEARSIPAPEKIVCLPACACLAKKKRTLAWHWRTPLLRVREKAGSKA